MRSIQIPRECKHIKSVPMFLYDNVIRISYDHIHNNLSLSYTPYVRHMMRNGGRQYTPLCYCICNYVTAHSFQIFTARDTIFNHQKAYKFKEVNLPIQRVASRYKMRSQYYNQRKSINFCEAK